MLNVTELKELQRSGATIGAHSISHPMLSQMAEGDAFEEISGSRSRLEAALGAPVLAFALPFGNSQAVSGREPELAKRAGFRCAFMNVEDISAEIAAGLEAEGHKEGVDFWQVPDRAQAIVKAREAGLA